MTLTEVLEKSKKIDRKNLPPYKIAILRNITIEAIKPYVEYYVLSNGFNPEIYFCDYDNVMQEVLNPQSNLYTFEPDVIIVVTKLENFSESLTRGFASLNQEAVSQEVEFILSYVKDVISAIKKNSSVPILLHNFETPYFPAFGVFDYQKKGKQLNTIRLLNLQILQIIESFKDVYVVDMDLLMAKVGIKNYYDYRYWYIGKAPYGKETYSLLAQEYNKFFRALKGKVKKCLVVDLDNTLWGGILGEDGISGIKIGTTYPGAAYREFQQVILNLYYRGVILAVCSKNNIDDVMAVFEKHPDMILKKEHFSLIKANWEDKANNIQRISDDLNIGLDSMVFIDDSEFETNLVRTYIPEVLTVTLPKDPTQYVSTLNALDCFDSLVYSVEDKNRNQLYQAESQRKVLKNSISNLSDFYQSLEMEVTIKRGDEFTVPRIAQLTQRTNQFNLTTQRYTEEDISKFIKSLDYDVYYLQLKDKFGDLGIVAVSILKYEENKVIIDSFLLSCRVIGRGVEDIFLNFILEQTQEKNILEVKAKYIKTKKNSQVKDFYLNQGFQKGDESIDKIEYFINVQKRDLIIPDYFKSINY